MRIILIIEIRQIRQINDNIIRDIAIYFGRKISQILFDNIILFNVKLDRLENVNIDYDTYLFERCCEINTTHYHIFV